MKHESTSVFTTGRRQAIWCSRLAVCLLTAAMAVTARAYLPPGATPAPNTAQTAAAFPKRVTAQGSNFGVWDQALTNPFFGRDGYYANTSVEVTGGGASIDGLLEFDAAGNTVRRISPLQTGVTVQQSSTAGQFYAQQIQTGANEVTFGLYSATGGFTPVYQNRLAVDASKTVIAQGAFQGRSVVVHNRNTQFDVMVFKSDGSHDWSRTLSSTLFGVTVGSTTDSQFAFVLPLADGSILVEVVKTTFSISLPNIGLGYDTILVKLSSTGTVEWAKKPSGRAMLVAFPSASGTTLYLNGTEMPTLGSTQLGITVSKMNLAGSLIWSKRVSGPSLLAAGELTGEKVLLTGTSANLQNPLGTSVLAVLSSDGNLESQTQFSFGERNSTVAYAEGARIWIATATGPAPTAGNPTLQAGPAHIGLADATLNNIVWKRYKNNMHVALASPDWDSDNVAVSFFNLTDHAMEVAVVKDDFAASATAELFTTAAPTVSSAGASVSNSGFTLDNVTVNAVAFTPAVQSGALTFETLPTIET
ncbi:MAG: hypothetical protein U1F61_13915, partial [Opitutaceae bacterium]